MAIVIPTARSTYGDATSMPGNIFRSYILAQLPDDADLGWVSDIRTLFVVDELKWRVFQSRRERLQAKKGLWTRILGAMRTATIVVIKPTEIEQSVRAIWEAKGAKEGIDFNRDALIDACATALIADTPVAYLPNHLSEMLGLYPMNLYLSFDKFAPKAIKKRIGGTLRDARVFAARAHAIFDLGSGENSGNTTTAAFGSPGASLILRELLSTQRAFDEEHPQSAAVLNEAVDIMAAALAEVLILPGEISKEPLVREYSSRDVNQLQAADIAAGWAHELVALSNEMALFHTFGKVIINGRIIEST